MTNIDTNLYSRQIKTYGLETMKRLQNLRILIIGMRGLGAEIAKNIILSGVKEVKIFDKNICQINELGNNFFLSEKNIGESRDISCLKKLKELNSYVNVEIFRGKLKENINNFNVVIITEIMEQELLFQIDEQCHKNNIIFIYCLNLGLSGFIFCDFGNEHIISDPTGKEKNIYFIKNIDKSGIITIDNTNRETFTLKKGNYIRFKEVVGINELNDGKPRQIINVSKNSFSIKGNYSYEKYKVGGVIEEVIFPKKMKYNKLKDCFNIPYRDNKPYTNDCTKEGRNELLHCALIAIHNYYSEKKSLPEINNLDEAKEVLERAKLIYTNAKNNNEKWINNIEDFDEQIILKVARWSKCQISPTCSFFGGIVAQEVVKKTGKYIPINQWLWFDFFETVENLNENVNRKIAGSRYDEQIAIFGQEIQKKLNNLNIFIIGAGALGCELLKNFSLMGISTEKNSQTIITDNDIIETSNLNRQFLFRQKDIGKSKSKIAKSQAISMNKDFKCNSLEMFINEENEDYFDEKFWKNQDFIFTAVDSKSARKYIDNQCTKYSRTLIDSGTLGTVGCCQAIVPFKTSCYNDNPDIPELSIPMCTLRNFPSKIEHCIEWGLSKFNEFFTTPLEELKKFLINKEDYYNFIQKEETTFSQISKMKKLKKLLEFMKENSFGKIIKEAVETYNEYYIYQIKKLIYEFPIDHKNDDDSLFWSGSKRFPHAINFDVKDEDCFNFIKYYSLILARSINVKIINDDNYIKNIAKKIIIPKFVPPTNKIPSREEELKEMNSLKYFLNKYNNNEFNISKISPEIFEKDNDSNMHVLFINICSNLRAKNYDIPKSNENQTKMIAGKIVPAIASTTGTIIGFTCLQLFTLTISNDIDLVKNCLFDSSNNFYQINNPSDVIHMEDEEYNYLLDGPTIAVPTGWTVWDIIEIQGPMTCQEFIDNFKRKYNIKISAISSNYKSIIQMFMPSKLKKLPLTIEEIYKSNCGLKRRQNCLWLEISGYINEINVVMPKIKYIIK